MNAINGEQSQWLKLLSIACDLINQVNSEKMVIDHWTLGGGTALMLHIDHRESHDVDIFLADVQYLDYLNNETHDFIYSVISDGYDGDGRSFRKFSFTKIGEIDFIVANSLTSTPTIQKPLSGQIVKLETIEEIITKKIYFRGRNLKPRDIFDIAAASRDHKKVLMKELSVYKNEVSVALQQLNKLNPEYVRRANRDLMIRSAYLDIVDDAYDITKIILEEISN